MHWSEKVQYVVLQELYFVSDSDGVRVRKCGQSAISKVEGTLDLDLNRLHPEHDFGLMLFFAVFYFKLKFLEQVDLLGTAAELGLEGARESRRFWGRRRPCCCALV
jgi:hypothetical protein